MAYDDSEYAPRFGEDERGEPVIYKLKMVRRIGREVVPENERTSIFVFCVARKREDAFAPLLRRRQIQYETLAMIQGDLNVAARGSESLGELTEATLDTWLADLNQPGLFDRGEG